MKHIVSAVRRIGCAVGHKFYAAMRCEAYFVCRHAYFMCCDACFQRCEAFWMCCGAYLKCCEAYWMCCGAYVKELCGLC